jgi:hypothetical protein
MKSLLLKIASYGGKNDLPDSPSRRDSLDKATLDPTGGINDSNLEGKLDEPKVLISGYLYKRGGFFHNIWFTFEIFFVDFLIIYSNLKGKNDIWNCEVIIH